MLFFGKGVPCSQGGVTEAVVLPNLFVRTCGISSWPEVEDGREAREGRTETGFTLEERYLGGKECKQRNVIIFRHNLKLMQ